jgi:hypothetical protein
MAARSKNTALVPAWIVRAKSQVRRLATQRAALQWRRPAIREDHGGSGPVSLVGFGRLDSNPTEVLEIGRPRAARSARAVNAALNSGDNARRSSALVRLSVERQFGRPRGRPQGATNNKPAEIVTHRRRGTEPSLTGHKLNANARCQSVLTTHFSHSPSKAQLTLDCDSPGNGRGTAFNTDSWRFVVKLAVLAIVVVSLATPALAAPLEGTIWRMKDGAGTIVIVWQKDVWANSN